MYDDGGIPKYLARDTKFWLLSNLSPCDALLVTLLTANSLFQKALHWGVYAAHADHL